MAKNLVIVESPAKAKTIEGYLGKDFVVKSSFGHVRDLAKKGLAIDVENNFKLDYALSREQENKKGGKMYIQDKVEEYSDEIFDRLDKGAHIYFCGLKGMMPGINDMLEAVCKTKKLDFKEKQEEWKKNGQWHVEVY